MTTEKLKELNQLAGKIELIKSNLADLSYIEEQEDFVITVKDGRKMGEHWVKVRVPRSLKVMICSEVRSKLEANLKECERMFSDE